MELRRCPVTFQRGVTVLVTGTGVTTRNQGRYGTLQAEHRGAWGQHEWDVIFISAVHPTEWISYDQHDLTPKPFLVGLNEEALFEDEKGMLWPGRCVGRGIDIIDGNMYEIRGANTVLVRESQLRVSAVPAAHVVVTPCGTCGKPNDAGVRICWCCGNRP